MGWVFEGVDEEDFTRQYGDWYLLRRIFQILFPFRKPFFVICTAIIFSSLVALVAPVVVSSTIQLLETEGPSGVLFGGFLYLSLNVISFGLYYLQTSMWGRVIPNFMVNLRVSVFTSLQKQDMKFYDTKRSGNLSSRVGGDAAHTADVVMLLSNFAGQVLLIFASFVVLFLVSSHLASYVLLVVPFVGGFTIVFRKLARRVSRIYRKSEAQINSSISESVEGIQIAKSYGREKAVLERFQKVNLVNYRAGLRQTLTMMLLFPTIDLLLGITILAILSIGGAAALAGQYGLSGANLYLFVMYLNTFFYPLMTMASFYGQLQSGFAAFERIATVLDAEPEVKQTGNTVLTGLDGDIKFENVSFSYNEKAQVLENFSLHIKPGEKLAIVGHTGAGKTSIINLIARFYEFQSGRLLVDNHDIRDLSLESYMSFLGIVQQDPFLFAGSVEENIKYGRSGASEDDVLKAIRSTKVDEFLKYLPEGLQTDVQERGKRLSTGQRQLVCFARALLADPRILILDEATSSVDAYTESIIQQALETLMEQRTSIVIAHRLSTVVNADRIIVLDHGKIIEEGSHEYLLTKKGKYQELFETYFKHQAPDWEPKVETKEILTPVATEY